MAQDFYGKFYTHLDSPAEFAFSITPLANTEATFTYATRSLYVGTGGDVKVLMIGDEPAQDFANDVVTFTNVQDGTILPIRVAAVYADGTTANNLVGLY